MVVAGVPNGLRNGVLYIADKVLNRYKRYRIPAHNNPFYTRQDDIDNIKRYGGEEDDRYQRLVLGNHGSAAYQVINEDDIKREPYPLTTIRYDINDKQRGIVFQSYDIPVLPPNNGVIFAIDTGYVDPTIINVIAQDNIGVWRTYIRIRLTRIDFNTQESIIDYLDTLLRPIRIAIDIGAGGKPHTAAIKLN